MKTKCNGIDIKIIIYILSFLIPLVCLLCVFYSQEMIPFGEKNMYVWDMYIQYKDIYAWFCDVLHGKASLFYDFSKSLGGNMYSVYACYLASPINFILFFFQKNHLAEFISLVTVIKICLCGLTCCIYIKKRFNIQNTVFVLILSTSYALIEYNVSLCSNLHFLDSIYILPIVALGCFYLVNENKCYILSLSIGYALLTNWYTGYMACVFSVIYVLFENFIKPRKFNETLKNAFRYIRTMIIGVLISAITFIPSILASINGKGQMDLMYLKSGFHNNIFIPLQSLRVSSVGNISYDEPSIYVGNFVLCLCILFLFSTGINLRKKVVGFLMLFSIYISFAFVPFELIWTMLKKVYSFHFRYSFCFSFVMIVLACLYLKTKEQKPVRISLIGKIGVLLFISLLIWVSITCCSGKIADIDYLGFFLLVLFLVIIGSYEEIPNYKIKGIFLCLVLLLSVFELYKNTQIAFAHYQIDNNIHEEQIDYVLSDIQEIQKEDSSFYRLEKTISTLNGDNYQRFSQSSEPLLYNYNGISHYSSFYETDVFMFLDALGYCNGTSMWGNYVDTNVVADSLMGIKYVITPAKQKMLEEIRYDKNIGAYIYKNPNALKFGVEVNGNIDKLKFSKNPFKNQEKILKNLSKVKGNIYDKQVVEQVGVSRWSVHIKNEGMVYLYFPDSHAETKLYVNDEFRQPYFTRACKNIVDLGYHKYGDSIEFNLDEETCETLHNPIVVVLNQSKFEEKISKLQNNTFEPEIVKDSYVRGTYSANQNTSLLLQVPYDKGWDLYINGKKTAYKKALNSLMLIEIPEGNNTIELKYEPPFFKHGVLLSIIGFFMLLYIEINKKNRIVNEENEND